MTKLDNEITQEFLPTDTRFLVTVDTKKFLKVINRASKVCLDNSVHPGADLIQLEAPDSKLGTEKHLIVRASSGTVFLDAVVPAQSIAVLGTIQIPHDKLISVAKQAKGETMTLACVGFEVQVSSENSMWRLKIPARAALPPKPSLVGENVTFSAPTLRRSFGSVLKAVAQGASRASLSQVSFTGLAFLACDGTRLHRQALDNSHPGMKFEIPGHVASLFHDALNELEGDMTIKVGEHTVSLITGAEILTTLRSRIEYPDVEKLFISQSVMNSTSVQIIRSEFLNAVKQVKTFADILLSSVHIQNLEDNTLIVQAEDELGNAAQARIQATVQGKDVVNLKLNYKHLIDALESIQSDVLTLRVGRSSKTDQSSAFLEDVESGFQAVLGQVIGS